MGKNTCRNLVVYRKTSKTFELNFTRNGSPEDITGWTVYFTAKQNMEDADGSAVISKDITSHLDATNGKTLVELSPTDTDLTNRSYYYDIKYLDDEGNAGILFHGKLLIREPVTTRG